MTARPIVRLTSGADSVELAWRERIESGQAQGLRHRVSFSIELEPSTLPDLVRAFERLA